MGYPTISVIIPCYNYARYVGEAIDSVLAQGYPAVDLVVVNDGSSDGSLEVIRRHARDGTIIDQPNRGHVPACNAGFAASRGDVVIFLDADDLLEPDALMSVASVWTPVLAKVQFDLKVIDAEGRSLGRRRFGHFGSDYTVERVRREFARNATYRWPVTSGNAYSRWFVSQVFPQRFRGTVDGYLNTIAPLYGDVHTLPEALGRYRLHDRNLSAKTRASSGLVDTIARRRAELAEMRRHAASRGVRLADADPLDHELPFLNYRLMAVRLGLDYPSSERDRPLVLLRKAWRHLRQEALPASVKLMHAAWFVVLAVLPGRWVSLLVKVRFERAQISQSWRQRLGRVAARGA
ncbi:MAG TPA: glycosyltransferase family 2 protein [Burkholderiales bacterium]|nr:glycosyltransferase family 2 protein [Burkholderiales bacterium]